MVGRMSDATRYSASLVERGANLSMHLGWFDGDGQRSLEEAQRRLDELVLAAAGFDSESREWVGSGPGPQRVLDVACGLGGTLSRLSALTSASLFGVDRDEGQLRQARQAPWAGAERAQFQQADACELPFEASSFDLLLSVEAAFHFRSRAAFFREAARVLRPLGLRRSTLAVTEALAGEAACGHLGRGSAVMAMNIADDLEIGAGGADWTVPAGGWIAPAGEVVQLALGLVDPLRSPLSAGAIDELLRGEVARFHGVPVQVIEIARTCPRCGSSDRGRPRVRATDALPRPASVSLSRAGRFSVVAVTDAGPVGVDVEAPGAADFPGFDGVAVFALRLEFHDLGGGRTLCHQQERNKVALWFHHPFTVCEVGVPARKSGETRRGTKERSQRASFSRRIQTKPMGEVRARRQ